MIESALTWLDGQRHAHLARAVSYSRGGVAVELDATKGRSTMEAPDDEGVIVTSETIDFIVRRADLAAAGYFPPAAGDVIEETLNGLTMQYEACHVIGSPPWRWTDPGQTGVRVHTRLVERV